MRYPSKKSRPKTGVPRTYNRKQLARNIINVCILLFNSNVAYISVHNGSLYRYVVVRMILVRRKGLTATENRVLSSSARTGSFCYRCCSCHCCYKSNAALAIATLSLSSHTVYIMRSYDASQIASSSSSSSPCWDSGRILVRFCCTRTSTYICLRLWIAAWIYEGLYHVALRTHVKKELKATNASSTVATRKLPPRRFVHILDKNRADVLPPTPPPPPPPPPPPQAAMPLSIYA